jgi:phosphopantothenoylcysteine decarboxylase/phosphopantothenate--cysteine ligase
VADDALLTEALAFTGPVLLAPAMNTRMWDAPGTRANLETLRARGVRFIGPAAGDLACGEVGEGKMSEPAEIAVAALALLEKGQPLKGKKVLVTSGPTRSYIDSVRFLTNRSSGRMGHALALTAEQMGAEVVLVTGPVEKRFATLSRGKVVEVETGDEMLAACLPELSGLNALFATAAVADFKMPEVVPGKLRREGTLNLAMIPSVDVLAELGKRKTSGQVFFGFAAEAGEGETEFAKARDKMQRKNLDFLALNNISRKDIGFDVGENEVHLFLRDGSPRKIEKVGKSELAEALLKEAFGL